MHRSPTMSVKVRAAYDNMKHRMTLHRILTSQNVTTGLLIDKLQKGIVHKIREWELDFHIVPKCVDRLPVAVTGRRWVLKIMQIYFDITSSNIIYFTS